MGIIMSVEHIIMIAASLLIILLMIFVIDWRYFRDWVVVFLFKCLIDFLWGSPVVSLHLIKYPVRLFPHYYETCLFFEIWVFPILCILYNQTVRERGFWAAIFYALLFSAGITAIEYPLELYTKLITYVDWSWFTTFYTVFLTFLMSRIFIAFFRWGCDYFGQKR